MLDIGIDNSILDPMSVTPFRDELIEDRLGGTRDSPLVSLEELRVGQWPPIPPGGHQKDLARVQGGRILRRGCINLDYVRRTYFGRD